MGWSGRAPAPLARKLWGLSHARSTSHVTVPPSAAIVTLGIDQGKNSFHLVGQDQRCAIVLQIKLSRAQLSGRLAKIPSCLIGMEACAGAHHIGRQPPWP